MFASAVCDIEGGGYVGEGGDERGSLGSDYRLF